MIRVTVEGRPAPKGSRIQGKTKTGDPYTYPASKFEKPWVDAVKRATQVAMRHAVPLGAPYYVDIELVIARPARPSHEWPTKADVDKLARSTIDGLVKGGALSDDRHVTALTVRKRYALEGESEGAHAQISGVMAPAAV